MEPNGYLFPVPKNSTKASMIVHMVKFNKAHSFKPTGFSLPTVEDLAFLIRVHSMSHNHLSLGGGIFEFPFRSLSGCTRGPSTVGWRWGRTGGLSRGPHQCFLVLAIAWAPKGHFPSTH